MQIKLTPEALETIYCHYNEIEEMSEENAKVEGCEYEPTPLTQKRIEFLVNQMVLQSAEECNLFEEWDTEI